MVHICKKKSGTVTQKWHIIRLCLLYVFVQVFHYDDFHTLKDINIHVLNMLEFTTTAQMLKTNFEWLALPMSGRPDGLHPQLLKWNNRNIHEHDNCDMDIDEVRFMCHTHLLNSLREILMQTFSYTSVWAWNLTSPNLNINT